MLITPANIREKAYKWINSYLSSLVESEPFFPKEIKFTKVKASWVKEQFQPIHEALDQLRKNSKEVKGIGYAVKWREIANRTVGKNLFPEHISIDCEADFLSLLKPSDIKIIEDYNLDLKRIQSDLPDLLPWVKKYPLKVCQNQGDWPSIIAVCKYFITSHERDRFYIRELPVEVHTKFIEQHKGILNDLLIILLDSSRIDPSVVGIKDHHFERRFGLKYDETLIRYRLLDASNRNVRDLSVRHTDFAQNELSGSQVIITENKMNFLILPDLSNTIAVWGGGFNHHLLRHAKWLESRTIYYWGDIDTHGLYMLSQLRQYFSNVTSLMMDWETFSEFDYQGKGKPINEVAIDNLTEDERTLFHHVKKNNIRLEQEKIPYYWINQRLKDYELS